jgi:hypothetical protein
MRAMMSKDFQGWLLSVGTIVLTQEKYKKLIACFNRLTFTGATSF